jgi:hypothetical protein
MEADLVAAEANDEDFDMLLEKEHDPESSQTEQSSQEPEAVFDALPIVWSGKVCVFNHVVVLSDNLRAPDIHASGILNSSRSTCGCAASRRADFGSRF